MELQIQDLVSSIKQDGIDSANREAAAIVAQAKAQADSIISQAKADADKLRQDANAEIEVFKNSARLSAEQAKRDAVLAFHQEIQKEFEKILAADVCKALDQQTLATLIRAALQGEDVSCLHGGGKSGDRCHPSGACPGAEKWPGNPPLQEGRRRLPLGR